MWVYDGSIKELCVAIRKTIFGTCVMVGAAVGVGVAGAEMGQTLWEQGVQTRSRHDAAHEALVQEISLSTARLLGGLALEAIAISALAVGSALNQQRH